MKTQAETLLKQYFGYDNFRPMQAQIIQSILNKKDALVLMPTGGGKSICFQVPALILPGLCVVISPLISLMKDQVDTLNANGIPAAFLNSSLDFQAQDAIVRKCTNNEIKILYISPERVTKEIGYLLKRLLISLFAIDEAHCVSSWGHDFRPEYTKLSSLKTNFPHIPMIALTATANLQTQTDIIKQLHLVDPELFTASFDRPNLSITVKLEVKPKQRTDEIIDFVKKHHTETGIIYCLSRNNCDNLTLALQSKGIKATSYHAGLSAEERQKAQDRFIKDKVQVVCATIAFGMGIDKSNVRYIIHYNVPKSIEGYYQEIGRAGRDGLASDTLMYFSYADLRTLRSFALESNQSQLNLEKLKQVQRFAEASSCRRRILLNYFGETAEFDYGNCDVCNPLQAIRKEKSLGNNLSSSNTSKTTDSISSKIFEGLRKLRRQIADTEKLPAYIVFSDATLKELSSKRPQNMQQMLDISGIGEKKLEKYGQQFLSFLLQQDTPQVESAPVAEIKPNKTLTKDTYAQTLSLYKDGVSIEEISRQRKLSLNTIYAHIEYLYKNNKIDKLEALVSSDEIEALRIILIDLAKPIKLKEIFESLNGSLEYYKIKLILAYLDKAK